jgi:hypothetical protein
VRGAFLGAAPSGRATSRLRARTKSLRFTSLEIAIGILRADPKEDVTPARGWALDIIEKNSGVPSPNKTENPSAQAFVSEGRPTGVGGDRGCGRFPRLAGSNDEEGRLPGDETARETNTRRGEINGGEERPVSTNFVMFTNAHTKKPILVNSDHIRTATEADSHNRVRLVMGNSPRRWSGTLSPLGQADGAAQPR